MDSSQEEGPQENEERESTHLLRKSASKAQAYDNCLRLGAIW